MDFSIACINSVGDNFPETEIGGCFFYFLQAIYRKILEISHAKQNCKDKEFNLAIHLLAALAFAPPLHIEAWYKQIQILISCHFPDYFMNYLRTSLYARKRKTRRDGNCDSTWICATFTSGPIATFPGQTMLLKDSTVDSNPCSECQILTYRKSLRPFRGVL